MIWKSDFWTTLSNILADAERRRRPEGILSNALDFMFDRLDDALEPVARLLGGRAAWDEMKQNARLATENAAGGARIALSYLNELLGQDDYELHLVSHSAGSILMGPLVQLLTTRGTIASGPMQGQKGLERSVASCTLWAPAITTELFMNTFAPAIQQDYLGRTAIFTLDDKTEQADNCARIYHKSLLYLVSNAFEQATVRNPFQHDRGVPLLGMEKFISSESQFADKQVVNLIRQKQITVVKAPTRDQNLPADQQSASMHHGDFDDDSVTLKATLARILNQAAVPAGAATPFAFRANRSKVQSQRFDLDEAQQRKNM